jgi:hypothetical protein
MVGTSNQSVPEMASELVKPSEAHLANQDHGASAGRWSAGVLTDPGTQKTMVGPIRSGGRMENGSQAGYLTVCELDNHVLIHFPQLCQIARAYLF